jgi:hypothetical protein
MRSIHLHPEIEKNPYLEAKRFAKFIAIETTAGLAGRKIFKWA